ncbi:MAG: hypothetical protein AB7N76_01065 [Planctomycetota bacterium]
MRLSRTLPLLLILATLASGARAQDLPISDERPLLLSELAAGLRAGAVQSGVDLNAIGDKIISALLVAPTAGAAPITLTDAQKQQLGMLVKGALAGDPAALKQLDSFPGWDVPTLGQGLRAELASLDGTRGKLPAPVSITEALGIPVADQTPPKAEMKPLGHGLYRGDVFDAEKAKLWPDSNRLADVLNRLSMNGTGWVTYHGQRTRTPRGLLELLRASGHEIEAHDHRSIANFSALYYLPPGAKALREVVAPLWLDTKVPVPGGDRTLLVPATHSELVISIRGPEVDADVAFYLGIDHVARFRPTAWRRPSWTGSKVVRKFEGDEALRAVSAAAWVRQNLTRLTAERNLSALKSGPYGQLGVCNDATALVEARLGLPATHWPLVRLPEVYRGTGGLEKVSNRIPYDTDGSRVPDAERVVESVPFEVGKVPDLFPTLAADLEQVAAAASQKGLATVASENLGH